MALQHLRSSTADKRPTPGAMSDGQLAINTNAASTGLFFKDSAGALVKVGPVHVGTTAPNASPAVGGQSGNTVGEQWLDTSGGTYVFKVWDGSAWRSETGTFVDVNGDVMTGALGIIAGTDSAPGLYFSGDTNTGLYSPGADQLALSTNGTGRLFIDANGDTGLGGNPSAGVRLNIIGRSGYEDVLYAAATGTNTSVRFSLFPTGTGGANINATANYLGLQVGGGEKLRITSAGQLSFIGAGTSGSPAVGFNGSAPSNSLVIDSSGRLLVGTSSSVSDTFGASRAQISTTDGNVASFGRYSADAFAPIVYLRKSRGSLGAQGAVSSGDGIGALIFTGSDGTGFIQSAAINAEVDGTPGTNDMPGRLVFSTCASGASSPTERMRITSGGIVLVGTTETTIFDNTSGAGIALDPIGAVQIARSAEAGLFVNRMTDDGVLVAFYQAGTFEGSISVSGTTVSYNGAHLSRWSQLPSGAERTEILRGTVLSNIDEMCEWGEEENEQLNRMKVSDVEGDKNVSGVFQAWDDDDDIYINDFYCAMTGDFIIRIGAGVTVERGDLLMSAGDGTAKPQDDDIIRSKTIAKVTSTNVSCTYDDGSYCVPCVLMAC